MSDIKIAYASSAAITNFVAASMATSSTLVAGYESDPIDNTTDLYRDYLIGGTLKVGSASVAAGVAEIWIIPMLDDSTWPDVFEGTASAETVTSREVLAAVGVRAVRIDIAAANDIVYPFSFSVLKAFGGLAVPKKFCLFTTHNSGVNLAATGHAAYKTGVYHTQA